MLSFENTEHAFAHKSDYDLKKAYWLFKIVSNNSVVKAGSILSTIALKLHLPIKAIIKATIFKQFCGGENIDECTNTIEKMGQAGLGTILDYSVEGKEAETDFDSCLNETINTIHKARENKHIPFCVFKVTGLARFALLEKAATTTTLSDNEKTEYEKVKYRINMICQTAYNYGIPVFIDAEESWIQNTIDSLAEEMMEKYNTQKPIVYNTFQMYRKDRLSYLYQSLNKAKKGKYFLGAKLVRGAYMDKERERAQINHYPSPIQNTKQDTDRDYNEALTFCLHNIDTIGFCAASHNEESMLLLAQLIDEKGIDKKHPHIFFAQLLGMSDHISYNLAHQGYNVAKYVPYGPVKEVLPYLIRRAQENTFVKGQTGRELSLIIKEKQRRLNNV